MYAKIKIFGDLYVKTGMHIGGSSAFAAIGAVIHQLSEIREAVCR